MTVLQRLAGPFREFGFGAGLLYVLGRLLEAISPQLGLYVYELVAQPIPEEPLLPVRLRSAFQIREIRAGDPDIQLMPARQEIKASRFAQGAVCLGAYRRDRLIGYLWLCSGTYHEDEVRCTYVLSQPERSVFDFDLYIFPEHRLGRGFAALWDGAGDYLRTRGVDFTFSRLTRFNLQSRRAHAHLGSRRVASAVFLKIGTIELMIATIAPFLHVSYQTRDRVGLRLEPTAVHVASATEKRDRPI
jgi:hypothetical protein